MLVSCAGGRFLQKNRGHKIIPYQYEDARKHHRVGSGTADPGGHSGRVIALVTANPHYHEAKDQRLVHAGRDIVASHVLGDAVKKRTRWRTQQTNSDQVTSPNAANVQHASADPNRRRMLKP